VRCFSHISHVSCTGPLFCGRTKKKTERSDVLIREGTVDMKLQDALLNWLQIYIVAEARPDDGAAVQTKQFFEQILQEDHHLTEFHVALKDEEYIQVDYVRDGELFSQQFDRAFSEKLLIDINSNPKYSG
jgi:hypothetical protein